MHAVVVRVAISDYERANSHLLERVVPGAKQAPGFVAGYWGNIDQKEGRGMVVFESEENARNVANMLKEMNEESVTVESVEVAEVDASA
ncbi:MAG: hypothetical protein ACRDPE_10970 [Solirubrobacterales bacterium]